MAEGAISWHQFVAEKILEGRAKIEDMETVTNDDDLTVKAKLDRSDAVGAEFCFVAKRDVPIFTRAIDINAEYSLSMTYVALVSAQHSSLVLMMMNSW